MKTKRQYLYNALLLTLVTLLMRTVSVSFNVYVSNRVGAEAMGLLSLVSGIYAFAITLATSGIQLATVRTVVGEEDCRHDLRARQKLRACLLYAAFFGILASVLLLTLAVPIGKFVLKETRAIRPLRMLSLTLLPIALTSVLNGYFTAVRRAWKNAVAQITEQVVKITFTGYLLVIVSPKTIEGSVLAILMGGAVSESLSLLFNWILYLHDKHYFTKGERLPKVNLSLGCKQVAAIAMPVAISAYVRSGLLAIEHILIPRGLIAYGAGNSAALAAYGALQSMALPVVLYPAAILSSFASLLIPEVTQQEAIGNKREIQYIAGRVYQMTLLFAIGVGGGMLFLSGELGQTLYGSNEVSGFIKALAPLIPIMYLDTATDAMLKGLGQQVYSMNVNIIDALVSVLSVAVLVPHFGILGYLITIYITEILNAALSVSRLLYISGFRPKLLALFVRPLLSIVGATSLVNLAIKAFGFSTISAGLSLVLHITMISLIYFLLLFLTGSFSKDDSRWLIRSFLPSFKHNKPLSKDST